MADAAISFAVQTLFHFAIEKARFLQEVEEEVRLLKAELKRMQCFLKDAGEKQAVDEGIRNWISEIREAAQDAEDVIDSFIVRVDNPRRNRGRLRQWIAIPYNLYNKNKIGKEIKDLQTRLGRIDQSRERYRIQKLGEGMLIPKRWENNTPPWQIDKHVVGIKKDVETLVWGPILKGKKGLSFAGIVGMVGSGKSTLARMVYNHRKVISRFDCRAWAVVSREFTAKDVMKELVLQLLRPSEKDDLKILKTMEKSEMPRLQRMLYERLKVKRFLIVLDDVWDSKHWECLTAAFPVEDKGSVLLLTSRRNDILSRGGFVHHMKKLDPKESRELFLQKALMGNTKTGSKYPLELEQIGEEILSKCDGLPLAISAVEGLVAKYRHSTGTELATFLKALNSQLGTSDHSSVARILELSYNDLPPQLKACFLCLAFFKEDEPIRAKRLVHVWIAQGREEETVQEIASGYLDEFVNRNVVEVKERGAGNRVKRVRLHDLLRKLCAKEEIGFEILRDESGSTNLDKPWHRAVYCDGERPSPNNLAGRNKCVRSSICNN